MYADHMIQHFWDGEQGNFFFTSDDHERLIVRTKAVYDLAIPSGNSMAALGLLRLYHMTQTGDYLLKAEQIMKTGLKAAAENPFGFGQLLNAIYLYIRKPIEITIIAKDTKQQIDSERMSGWLGKQFIPNSIVALVKDSSQLVELNKYPFFSGKKEDAIDKEKNNVDNRNARGEYAFVCRNFSCSLPIYSLDQLQEYIRRDKEQV